MQFWHYTKSIKLPEILRDGKIKRTIVYFKGDRSCVWASTNDDWDNGAGKLVPDQEGGDIVSCDPGMLFKFGYGAVAPIRIRLNPDIVKIVSWKAHIKTIPSWVSIRKELGGLFVVGANTDEWVVCYEDVPLSSCIFPIEKRVGHEWVALPHMQCRSETSPKGELKMIVDDLEKDGSKWFELDGGGRVKVKTLEAWEYDEIMKKVAQKKTSFVLNPKTRAMEKVTYTDLNEELQDQLFYDTVIVSWENIIDSKGAIPCTKENKVLLMKRSAKFKRMINDCQMKLHDLNLQREGNG